jgi:hypothetical protein
MDTKGVCPQNKTCDFTTWEVFARGTGNSESFPSDGGGHGFPGAKYQQLQGEDTIHGGEHSSAIKQPATLRIQILYMIFLAKEYRINQR